MKAASVSLLDVAVLLLSGLKVSAVSLNVSPNRQQFFMGESFRLSCKEEQSSAGWTLKRISAVGRQIETCGAAKGFGRPSGSSCIVSDLSPSADRGVYWCEHSSGQSSIKVSITVSGSHVTLRCRNRNGSTIPVNFFKYSTPIGAAPEGEFTISNVQQADEGFYWCSAGQAASPSSRLNVRAPPPTNAPPLVSVSPLVRLLCHLVVISTYCVSTVLMVSIYCCRKTPAVTMEMAQRVENGQGLDSSYVNDAADVTTEHDF
ncbi:uncharacterized protein LOC122870253 isoform X2 [Siniperca chuatsi]|uniref:uncharacterized protein LOC122870253 isoform X2 n=1 Tax=Siniperca chuatsi TaxID=119488 RepID=UPI001CE0EEAB|nr:uncharacterized protein LOC122870253 isoform X2 [Siniperca chuatsi]